VSVRQTSQVVSVNIFLVPGIYFLSYFGRKRGTLASNRVWSVEWKALDIGPDKAAEGKYARRNERAYKMCAINY